MDWESIKNYAITAVKNLRPGCDFPRGANPATYEMLKSRYVNNEPFPSEIEIITEVQRIIDEDVPKDIIKERLAELDAVLSRETEDVIKTMIQKGVISISDLPQILVDRYNEKETLRAQLP